MSSHRQIAIGLLAAAEPTFRNCGFVGVLRLYRSFLIGLASTALAIAAGVAAGELSDIAAVVAAGAMGAASYPLLLRLGRSGLTGRDREVFIRAVPQRLDAVMGRLLGPITREGQT